MTTDYSFKKEERLCSKKAISDLFENGNSFFHFPFRILWMESKTVIPFPAQIAITVPKKKFKKAYERNRIKRLIREAWRLNKHKLYSHLEKNNSSIEMMLIYTPSEMPDYKSVLSNTEQLITKLLLILPPDSNKQA